MDITVGVFGRNMLVCDFVAFMIYFFIVLIVICYDSIEIFYYFYFSRQLVIA